ncbi:hypothetical protein [Pantoea sp.]|nr:hypothetical protein [Pantoea sp.]MDU4127596.1 hypothetical protein [Pantoea sp.]
MIITFSSVPPPALYPFTASFPPAICRQQRSLTPQKILFADHSSAYYAAE